MAGRDHRGGLVRQASVLAGAGFLVKIIGGLLRIPLTRMMGPEGMGLYQMAYSVYGLLITLCVSGFPLAVSKLVAESRARCQSPALVFRACVVMLGLVGVITSAWLYAGADFLAAKVLGDPRAAIPIRGIAPAMVLVAMMAVFRGYFQGHQRMGPTALSQIVEQVTRVTMSLALVSICLPLGLGYAAGGASFGTTLGALAGMLLLIGIYRRHEERVGAKKDGGPGEGMMIRVISLAVPISLGALLLPGLDALNAFLIPSRLQAVGMDVSQATGLYGQLAGVALPMMGLPAVASISLAASLVPAVAAASASRDASLVAIHAGTAMTLALMLSLPAAGGLWVLSGPISSTLFHLPQVGPLLRIVAPGCIFLSLQQTSTGILLGLGRPSVPVASLILGLSVNGVLVHALTVLPGVGITGAALALPSGLLTASVFNLWFLRRILGQLPVPVFRPLLAVGAMMAVVMVAYPALLPGLGDWGALIASVVLGAGAYFLGLLGLGVRIPLR